MEPKTQLITKYSYFHFKHFFLGEYHQFARPGLEPVEKRNVSEEIDYGCQVRTQNNQNETIFQKWFSKYSGFKV